MERAETLAHERAGQELVAYMGLETMFPDQRVRTLAQAAGNGNLMALASLVDSGVDVNARGNRNATPLFWAMRSGSLQGFNELLRLGADPNVVFDDGGTVIHWAVRHASADFLKAALAHGGDPNLRAGQLRETPMFEALGERSDRLGLLLDAGGDPDVQDSFFGSTVLLIAAGRGRFDLVMVMLEHGADFRLRNKIGSSLKDVIAEKRDLMDPQHELYAWMQRVTQWLEARGVEVPASRNR